MFISTKFSASNEIIHCQLPKYSCKRFSIIMALSGIIVTGGAYAQTVNPEVSGDQTNAATSAPPASPWSANITLASQYIARGFRQTWGHPALQGGIDYAAPNGMFFGIWTSNVSDKFIQNGNAEIDLYGGYGGNINDDISYSTNLIYYVYPGGHMTAGRTSYNYGELVLSGTYKWITLKYLITVTRDYFGFNSTTLGEGVDRHSRGSGYLDLTFNIPLGDKIDLHLHYGNQRVANFSHYSWQDIKASISKGFDGGWKLEGGVTYGHNSHGVYDKYTTGVPNENGYISASNPLKVTPFVTLTKTF